MTFADWKRLFMPRPVPPAARVMGLLNGSLPALRVLARELDLGDVPVESHGRAAQCVLGGWLVLRDGMIIPECTAEVVSRINARLAELFVDGQWGTIGALHYAAAVLVRGEV